jgi:hypothetical protein
MDGLWAPLYIIYVSWKTPLNSITNAKWEVGLLEGTLGKKCGCWCESLRWWWWFQCIRCSNRIGCKTWGHILAQITVQVVHLFYILLSHIFYYFNTCKHTDNIINNTRLDWFLKTIVFFNFNEAMTIVAQVYAPSTSSLAFTLWSICCYHVFIKL